ncbi:hypothetical protein [Niabella ginsengisoli]|uniref:Uncharacterized protein n=1 Tax=Niabella ginsengisoli TaxID=522298 RepID=A0ABS9SGI0_9BACT|nr:hypothetical protein [Niabella ginsengisoli]MCH5597472.1 hypothetical protein [Niabella ginsengisoli]
MMKKKSTNHLVLWPMLALAFALHSCKDKAQGASQSPQTEITETVNDTLKSRLRPNEKIELGKIYTDTVNFVEFNDGGDNWLLFVEKNKDTIGLIYDNEYHFIRGDAIAITWKKDSIRYAGDSEFLNFTEFLISAKTVKPLSLTDKK